MIKEKNPIIENHSSRVKDIYIELHNYTFFHSPFEIANPDRRFIGRQKLVEKLKTILLNSETRTGAYLITGYRGTGKSSYVNKVVDEISSCKGRPLQIPNIIRIIFLAVLFIILQTNLPLFIWAGNYLFGLAWAFTGVLGFFLYWTSRYRNDLKGSPEKGESHLTGNNASKERKVRVPPAPLKVISEILDIKNNPQSNHKMREVLKEFLYVMLLFLLYNWLRGKLTVINDLYILLIITGALLLVSPLLNMIIRTRTYEESLRQAGVFRALKISAGKLLSGFIDLGKRLFQRISSYYENSRRVNIKINLGSEDLKEIDLLRLIARNIQTQYREFTSFSKRNWVWRLFLLFIIYSITGIAYYHPIIYEINDKIKNNIHLTSYFPSQFSPVLTDPTNRLERTVRILNIGHKLSYKSYIESLSDYGNEIAVQNPGERNAFAGIANDSGSLGYSIASLTSYIDLLAYMAYRKAREELLFFRPEGEKTAYTKTPHQLKSPPEGKAAGLAGNGNKEFIAPAFRVVPYNVDYLLIFYCFIAWLSVNVFFRFQIFDIMTHRKVMRKINHLNDIISANVTVEKGGETGLPDLALKNFFFKSIPLKYSAKKTKAYPVADMREIEKGLIEILSDISEIPKYTLRPEFIIIFDELDKIEPKLNAEVKDQEDLMLKENLYFAAEGIRGRQQSIMKLFANMKYFLSTAKAKFIFIAGREMYDAALADVSDRNYFIGSIFNDVINVNSFLSERDKDRYDVTTLTERYVCQYLLPEDLDANHLTLKEYNEYLKEYYKDDRYADVKREKVIFILQQFITYLTYRSNGAPRKIAEYFEQYVSHYSQEAQSDSLRSLSVGRSSKNLYLEFNFYDQYTFGVCSYIINPIFQNIIRSIRHYNDKMLVSSFFLIDHLYKFHRTGFSLNNLEITPEILDINKAPHLRELITKITRTLSKTHIQQIDNGLYNYKFSKKIDSEITFLSKVNESESAAFNFTLDESLAIKRHYKKRLNELEINHKPYSGGQGGGADFISSLSYVHMILGDLHFYDNDFDNAIIEYMEAAQFYAGKQFEGLNSELFVLLIFNTLKLGLAYERRKNYDSAFMTYGKLASSLIKFRSIDKEESPALSQKYNCCSEDKRGNIIDDFIKHENFCVSLEDLFFKLTVIERLRLMYQPFLAKFQISEKATPSGVSSESLKWLEREIQFLIGDIIEDKNSFTIAELKNRIGDILFFKNGLLQDFKDHFYQPYCSAEKGPMELLFNVNGDAGMGILQNGYLIPCTACKYYKQGLILLLKKYFRRGIKSPNGEMEEEFTSFETILTTLLACLDNKASGMAHRLPESVQKLMGEVLSDLGDTFLSCSPKEKFTQGFFDLFYEIITNPGYTKKAEALEKFNARRLNKLQEALICFYLSSIFYKRAGDYRENVLQLTKIIYVIHDNVEIMKKEDDFIKQDLGKSIIKTVKTLMNKVIKGSYKAYEDIHRIEIEKYSHIFNPNRSEITSILSNQSLNMDLREINTLYYEMLIDINPMDIYQIDKKWGEYFPYPYSVINSMYNRILELKLKTKLNLEICRRLELVKYEGGDLVPFNPEDGLENLLPEKEFSKIREHFESYLQHGAVAGLLRNSSREVTEKLNITEYLITDSIFCLNWIILTGTTYGITYIINHSLMASIHEEMGLWCRMYENFKAMLKRYASIGYKTTEEIDETLEHLINRGGMHTLSSDYHYESALRNYRQAIETHSEGKAYKNMIEDMVYLNDDYNDNFYHFCASRERYKINTGFIKCKIEKLKELADKTLELYKAKTYTGS
ncbi:MAG: ATP-binding protein [Ignavibacteria bacterium]|jgi:hypothetical protein|nr:ATP-binding protein [Ignavibacteria bacterium]MCU7502928.1 ATP-binding protein [Ignavibacteria bacterium]MCU7515578.1 ATP-binding protein [Ignavibacteria bacterium]